MEIPYVVTPRKDTGLFNSKIAIWLFLASEVMLFGGFFSAYVFLRLGADYPWPERALPVLPGLINTFVLIFSSVTVVFAWASLKMRQWRRFQVFMGITVACAAIFMVLKGIEYNVKLHHQAVRLKDYTVIEGHLGVEKENGKPLLNHHGKEMEENLIFVKASKLTFNTVSYYRPWVTELLSQAGHHHAKVVLAADVKVKVRISESGKADVDGEVIAKAGDALSVELLDKIQRTHILARNNNSKFRTEALRQEWATTKSENPGKKGWQLASTVNIDMGALKPMLLDEIPSVAFKIEPPVKFDFPPRDIQEAPEKSILRDQTVIEGELLASPMVFHAVDAIDFQHLAMKAVAKGIDPLIAIENSWAVKNSPFVKSAWEWNKEQIAKLEKELIEKYGVDKKTGKPMREPTAKERYRIGWKDLIAKADGADREKEKIQFKEEFLGPDYAGRESKETFVGLSVPREQVGFAAKFTPAWNTYYAIYFTMTGLHGLHVIGGALVLAYYLFFGRKMYLQNPEWLANRVEIGGLFWHFVDLVWIFVFPILYLM
jgi:heme/copper-type cytochrome/quinol oxidase subunit 3